MPPQAEACLKPDSAGGDKSKMCMCRRLAAFIDGEADVSDAGDWSSDEDADGADEDLSGLIDDTTQQPGSVQPRRCAASLCDTIVHLIPATE